MSDPFENGNGENDPFKSSEILSTEAFKAMDRMVQVQAAKMSGGISPAAVAMATLDWGLHLATSPGKQIELMTKAVRKAQRLGVVAAAETAGGEAPPTIAPLPGDYRFKDADWNKMPYSLWKESFLLLQQWWHNATHEVPGVSPHHQEVVSFMARQMLDVVSPSNIAVMNPEVIRKTQETGGQNLVQGWRNWLDDQSRQTTGQPPAGVENFEPGKSVAVTPGKVVLRNDLIELIQYSPATDKVKAEPILFVPAWIMKYYILDLSPQNSMIRYLVEKGHTVFCISWRNPDHSDRNRTFDDYRRMGVLAALDAIAAIVPNRKVHGVGYCLGGTLLTITAAAMARTNSNRFASVTLLAAQTDFTEPGELGLFIDHSQMHMLESVMWNHGYLDSKEMSGAFQMLRTNDLIWSRIVHEYMMGERSAMNDLMAWNADATRMPYRMHSEYLRRLYLNNELATGRFVVDGHPAVVQNIHVPIFAVGTETDHVAPWHSVYKIHYLTDTELTFALTNGGHNAGIVSEPGRKRRHYRIATQEIGATVVSADEWAEAAEPREGSWWLAWADWLSAHSSAEPVAPPAMGNATAGYPALADAPGHYVHQH